MKLRPHQQKALEELSDGKVLYGGVGSGKSLTAIAYYIKHHSDKDLYVITTTKKRDRLEWEGEAVRFGVGRKRDATLAGIIVVDSWHNIGKYVDVENAFFIFDEQRVTGTGAWVKHFLKITKKNNWILLSATPGDKWSDYAPIFVANGLFRNITEFNREHVVYAPFLKFPKILRYLNEPLLEKYRNMLLVEMPYLKHTKRIEKDVINTYDKELLDEIVETRWHPEEDRPIRNVSEFFQVVRKIVNTDRSRIEALLELLQRHPRIIVFYNFNYELEILRKFADGITVAEWNGQKHEEIPKTDRWIYCVQYLSGAEGWNCTETDTMVFWSLTYSWRQFEQAKGRIDRLDTPFTDLYYYVFRSESWIDKAILRALRTKKIFNERQFSEENPMLCQILPYI